MYPILLKIGPLSLYSYGFFMALGVGLGLWFLYVQAKKRQLDVTKITDAAFYTVIVSLIGSKSILLIGNFSYYVKFPKELFSLARSGGVFQGGLTFGVIFALWYFHKKRIPTWTVADLIAPALALGHGFGRIGCFLAGCCYGSACDLPWGATTHSEHAHELTGIPLGVPLHPVQLLEAGLNFLNFFVLFRFLKNKKYEGQIFCLYIINYSVIRFFTEFFRGDHEAKTYLIHGSTPFLSLSLPQLYCLIGLLGGLILAAVMKKRQSV